MSLWRWIPSVCLSSETLSSECPWGQGLGTGQHPLQGKLQGRGMRHRRQPCLGEHACSHLCAHTHTFTHLPSQPRILTFTRTFFFFFFF